MGHLRAGLTWHCGQNGRRPSEETGERCGDHRLLIMAPAVLDAVTFAGGWLFDRVMAGWTALVLTTQGGDDRPLRILGAHTEVVETALSCAELRRPGAAAISAELYADDPPTLNRLLGTVRETDAEIIIWGDSGPAGPDVITYRLSSAARAFKAHALAAAGAPPGAVGPVEIFRGSAPGRPALRCDFSAGGR